jgi:hypothetical protein
MIELIFFIIFVLSFVGILYILIKKIPVLNTMPQNGNAGIREHHYVQDIERKIKEIIKNFEKQNFLHKFLSFAKVMILRLEIRIDKLLHKVRKKAQEKK